MKKIVVFLHNRNFFGAQIVHIPLLISLKKLYPEAEITLFSKNKISFLLEKLDYSEKVIIEDSFLNTLKAYTNISPDLTIVLRKNSLSTNLLVGLSNFRKKIGFTNSITKLLFSYRKKFDNQIYRAFNFTQLLDIEYEYPKLSEKRDVVSIIPGAGGKNKIWNIENYIAVAEFIKNNYQLDVEFILGNEEQKYLQLLQDKFTTHFNTDIKTLETNITTSTLVLANDCGPSHFAQINNISTLILYTNDNAKAINTIREWFNSSLPNHHYMVSETGQHINSIQVDDVIKEVKSLL